MLTAVAVGGCWKSTTRSSRTSSEAHIRCLDCDEPVAVGMPIRVSTSWAATCSSEGFTWSLDENRETEDLHWKKSSFSKVDRCDRKSYKVDVTCTQACIVYAMDDPELDSSEKLVAIFPTRPGPMRFDVKMRGLGTSRADTPAAHIAGDVVVRVPDFSDDTPHTRVADTPSPLAAFASYTYDLEPSTRHGSSLPGRGKKSAIVPAEDEAFDRIDRACFTREPGAATWRTCEAGIRAGDDVRIDAFPTLAGQPLAHGVTLASTPPGATDTTLDDPWICYRTPLRAGQTCVRYAIPAGVHELHWRAGSSIEHETLPVTLDSSAAVDPTSLTISAPQTPTVVSFDSRELFDSRGVRGTAMLVAEGEILGLRDDQFLSVSVVAELPLHPRWGALRLGVGGFEDGDKYVRIITGWELPVGCLAYRVCLGIAADVGYSFVDPIEGLFALPHLNLDVRGGGLIGRFGAGPSYVLGTWLDPGQQRHELGYVIKFSIGFARQL